MIVQTPYSGQRGLVLAFDVGTTHSGISYCILTPGQIAEVRQVTRFPGQKTGSGNAKVPSILYYDIAGNIKAAGSEALGMDVIETAVEEHWMKAEWWKFHFCHKRLASGHINGDNNLPLPHGKSAVDVLSDFIKYLFQCAKTYIEEHHMGFRWSSIEDSIDFVFTHPNDWEGIHQRQYRVAVERAGLVSSTSEGKSRVHLITESEASLHYYVSCLSAQFTAEPQGVVIIDAGGGTIDLSMYSLTSNLNSCDEIVPAECLLQGSMFVSRRATDLLKRKLQESPHFNAEEIDTLSRKFDENTKLTISSTDKAVYLKIGTPCYNNSQYNINHGALKLSGEEIANLFDEPINAIIHAFEQQRRAATLKIYSVFLVGGLGGNELLWSHLQSYFEDEGIKLSRAGNINKTVTNGALLHRIYPDIHIVRSRVARATYGIPHCVFVDENNPEHLRRKGKWEKHSSGRYRIPGAFDPILHRGDRIDQREIRRPFSTSRRDRASFVDHQIRIICYQGTMTNPRWLDEDASSFYELCTISVDLRRAVQNSVALKADSEETYYQAHYNVIISFGSEGISAEIAWWSKRTEERAPATIVYHGN